MWPFGAVSLVLPDCRGLDLHPVQLCHTTPELIVFALHIDFAV